jgi:hypothetical protein
VGEAGEETGEESCGSETYTFSPKKKPGGEATAPTVLPPPSKRVGPAPWVRFGAGRDEDRLNMLVTGT